DDRCRSVVTRRFDSQYSYFAHDLLSFQHKRLFYIKAFAVPVFTVAFCPEPQLRHKITKYIRGWSKKRQDFLTSL
ncbi:MAG: hypothetical protein K2M02_02860, partial [Duncaniella sp.]|nr:hypothetical protein [Duncaniella sp.]